MVKNKIKKFIKKVIACVLLEWEKLLLLSKQYKELRSWARNGRPVPPPHIVKQRTIKAYAKKYKITNFIETGTYFGDMVEATKYTFKSIISIELDHDLYNRATQRFNNLSHIRIIHGDSSKVMPIVLNDIYHPVLFWLDGHFSGGITAKGERETPIQEELEIILNHKVKDHVIVIDDARLFGVDPDYPPLNEVEEYVRLSRKEMSVVIKDDMIRITPQTKSNRNKLSIE